MQEIKSKPYNEAIPYQLLLLSTTIGELSQKEEQLRNKDHEYNTINRQYGDTRVSVLGFKAQIMKLTGELAELRNSKSGDPSTDEVSSLRSRDILRGSCDIC